MINGITTAFESNVIFIIIIFFCNYINTLSLVLFYDCKSDIFFLKPIDDIKKRVINNKIIMIDTKKDTKNNSFMTDVYNV